MDRTKIEYYSLIAIIALLTFYIILSGNKARKEIKRLNSELKVNVDSIKRIQSAYVSLQKNYETIYTKLDSTRSQFNTFHRELDSIMHADINSLTRINRDLKNIVNNEKPIPPTTIDRDTFMFK